MKTIHASTRFLTTLLLIPYIYILSTFYPLQSMYIAVMTVIALLYIQLDAVAERTNFLQK